MINRKPNTNLKFILFLGILIGFHSCETKESLTFHKRTIAIDDFFDCQTTDCAITEILLVTSLNENEISKKINQEIEKAASSVLNLEDDMPSETIEEAIQNFNNAYQEIKQEFPEEIIPYEVSINSEISFQNPDILSILIDSYIFTGGAHGSGNSTYLNIDLKTGTLIENRALFKDYKKFINFVEKIFRKTHNIALDESINSTGFFFENNQFQLSSAIGFTDTQIILFYNQYEISSYAEGPIELKLNKEEIIDYLSVNIL